MWAAIASIITELFQKNNPNSMAGTINSAFSALSKWENKEHNPTESNQNTP